MFPTLTKKNLLGFIYISISIINISKKSSASVFLHHCGLFFLRKTVNCDGDVCVFEDLIQYLWHACPLESIQATADTVREIDKEFNYHSNLINATISWF